MLRAGEGIGQQRQARWQRGASGCVVSNFVFDLLEHSKCPFEILPT